jgi:hypothetical protein
MLFLIVSVITFGLLLCGIGCFFARLFGYTSPRNPWIYFWLGLFVTGTSSIFASLFVSISDISLIIFFIIGIGGLPFFLCEYKISTMQCHNIEIKFFIYVVFSFLVAIAFLAAFLVWPSIAYDADLYHAQAIRWYNEYGTPFGLGNLHSRLAFNSLWLSVAALFDNGFWDGRSAWIMPVLALLGGILYFLHELIFSRRKGTRFYAVCMLVYICLKSQGSVITSSLYPDFPAFGLSASIIIPSLYYDFPVHILNAIVVLEVYCLFINYERNLSKQNIREAIMILMLSVCSFMIKPIGAVTLLFSGLLVLFLLARNKKQSISSYIIIFAPALCAFTIWVIKNAFLSGYLMYPLPYFAMPFDWTMPFELANSNYKAVLAWARMPGPNFMQSLENGFSFWFLPWITSNIKSSDFIMLAVFPSILSILFWFFVIRYASIKKASYFLIWVLFSVIYWFKSAPDLRFGDGFFWVCLGVPFLFLYSDASRFSIVNFWRNPKIRITFFYICCSCIFFSIVMCHISSVKNLLTIGTIPSRPIKEYTVNTTPPFTVWMPKNGDQTGNSPLPSTPYVPNNIEMREPGNLGKGFRPIRH